MKLILQHRLKIDVKNIVDTARNGKEAFMLVQQDIDKWSGFKSSYNLILMDCNMPFMDGYQASQMIRQYIFGKNLL